MSAVDASVVPLPSMPPLLLLLLPSPPPPNHDHIRRRFSLCLRKLI